VPAAAVIPAPIAYIKVVAVKKLVVEGGGCASARGGTGLQPDSGGDNSPMESLNARASVWCFGVLGGGAF
jgi:hypothetical protein